MTIEPDNSSVERRMGLAMLGTILFCAASGTGVGVFFESPEVGGFAGAVVGIVIGLVVVPGLIRDVRD